jgi:hypothetical protein
MKALLTMQPSLELAVMPVRGTPVVGSKKLKTGPVFESENGSPKLTMISADAPGYEPALALVKRVNAMDVSLP